MSNAYVFDACEENTYASEFIAIGHTSGAVSIYEKDDYKEDKLFVRLSTGDLEELLELAKSSA